MDTGWKEWSDHQASSAQTDPDTPSEPDVPDEPDTPSSRKIHLNRMIRGFQMDLQKRAGKEIQEKEERLKSWNWSEEQPNWNCKQLKKR